MDKEYIERETMLARVDAEFFKTDPSGEEQLGFLKCRRIIRELPAADVAPVVHAEWIPSPEGINPIKCRRCGTVAPYRMESDFNHAIGLYPYKSNYCPHCGARMDGGKHGQA